MSSRGEIERAKEAREAQAGNAVNMVIRQSHDIQDYAQFQFDALRDYSDRPGARYGARNREPLTRDALYDRLATQFDTHETGFTLNLRDAFRRSRRPSDEEAAATVEGFRDEINTLVGRVNGMRAFVDGEMVDALPGEIDPELLRAVMFMEVRYNPDVGNLGRTKGIMNVNYDLWEDMLDNHGITETMLSKGGMVGTPPQRMSAEEVSIYAGAIILSHLDATIPDDIQGPDRVALIASMYANTDLTLEAGRPIMYGGKALEVMEERYPSSLTERAVEAPTQHNTYQQCQVAALNMDDILASLVNSAGIGGDIGELNAQDARAHQSSLQLG